MHPWFVYQGNCHLSNSSPCCCLHAADVNHDAAMAMWQQQNVQAPLRRQDDKEQNRPAQLMIPDTQHRLLILAIIFSVLHKIASAIYKYNQRGKPTSLHRAVGHTTKTVKGETKREDLRKWHFSCLVISWVHHALCRGKGALLLKKGSRQEEKDIFSFSSPSLY